MQENLKNENLKREKFESYVEQMLILVGEDPNREGLVKTPERVFKAYEFLTSGYSQDPKVVLNDALFDSSNNEMVLVRDIEFYSLCEHHLLPFFGRVHVAYIPNHKVVGLSKIPRMVNIFARRLQIQEQLTEQIADSRSRARGHQTKRRGCRHRGAPHVRRDARRGQDQLDHYHFGAARMFFK